MREGIRLILEQTQYFGLVLSIGAYLFACWLKNKTKLAILNPLLVSAALIIACILGVGMDYETYNKGASYLSWLLTPATVCLAIPLYKQLHLLKKHADAVAVGITSGVVTSAVSIFLMCKVLGMAHVHYVTLLPKSITTAIGMGISEEAGGIVTLTVMSIILTGVLGNMAGETVLKLLKVRHPVAKGLAMGTSAHAVGTAKALEMGEIEGAMSSLSIAVAGLMTVIVFIFDLNTEYKYRELLADNTFAEAREESSFIWDNFYDESSGINEYDLTLFIREGQLYRKYEETHFQKAYSLDEVKRAALEAGMEFVAAYDACTRNPVREDSERIYVIMREQGKTMRDEE